ncbi:MAG: hypothetical protein IJK35_09460 [Oscillospiraceae bacterium]|nr:hypothetical protein [Oscillospiraceae bacterium]
MPRIRTIDQAFMEIKKRDPDTALTKTGLRRLVTTHAVPSFLVGCKYMIDLDKLEAYLQGSIPNMETAPGIREMKL